MGRMKATPAFQFYPRDFLGDARVAAMTNQEVGVYVKLICHCWTEGSIPADVARLAVMAGERYKDMLRIWTAVGPCFIPAEPGRLTQKRLEQVRREQANFREAQRLKGIASGRARREPRLNPGSTPVQPGCQPESNSASAGAPTEPPPVRARGRRAAPSPDGGPARPSGAGRPPATAESEQPERGRRRLAELETCPCCFGPTLLEPLPAESQFCTDHDGPPFPVSGVRVRRCSTRRKETCKSWVGERHAFGPQDCAPCALKRIGAARAAS
jgi:uncharacterized protein YdaU (DUF1376 family)